MQHGHGLWAWAKHEFFKFCSICCIFNNFVDIHPFQVRPLLDWSTFYMHFYATFSISHSMSLKCKTKNDSKAD